MQKALQQKIGFGTALPDGGWKFTVDRDPNPRIPLCVEAPATKRQAISWTIVAIGALILTYALTRLA